MKGFFSGVWGVSSVVGPLLGGFLVDQVSWHWVFYVNVFPGLLAGLLVWFALGNDERSTGATSVPVDYLGAGLLTASVVALLLGLLELGTPASWALLAAAAVLFAVLLWIEGRAADPMVPLPLFRGRMFAVACVHGVLAGCAMFGSLAFVPLFVQAVLGTSATAAGSTLTPMLISWVAASIISSRLLLRLSYRALALFGMLLFTVGAFMMTRLHSDIGQLYLMVFLSLMGIGMGCSIPAFLIAVQSVVERRAMGVATSTLQFSRSIGGTLGVSVMGAALSLRLAATLRAAGMDPSAVSVNSLLDPLAGSASSPALNGALRDALTVSIQGVFIIAFVAAVLGLAVTTLAPDGRIAQLAAQAAPARDVEQPVPTTLSGD
jgi:MFS family permease